MNDKQLIKSDSPTIFDRLQSRGIDYVAIKKLISFDLPHAALYFESHFGPHTPPQALQQAGRWRELLDDDFLVPGEQKEEIRRTLTGLRWPRRS
jgi:hypothetical protein